MSMWEHKLELDPLFITCILGGEQAWESDVLAAACTM